MAPGLLKSASISSTDMFSSVAIDMARLMAVKVLPSSGTALVIEIRLLRGLVPFRWRLNRDRLIRRYSSTMRLRAAPGVI